MYDAHHDVYSSCLQKEFPTLCQVLNNERHKDQREEKAKFDSSATRVKYDETEMEAKITDEWKKINLSAEKYNLLVEIV